MEQLPSIDAVLISHNHYDHLDIPTLRKLAEGHQLEVFAGLGNNLLFEEEKIEGGRDLDWGESAEINDEVRVTFLPCQHWSGRGLSDRKGTLWGAFVIESPSGNIYYAGDTGDGPHFEKAAEEFGPFRAVILPVGAYLPQWFMGPVHLSPHEAVEVHRRMDSPFSVACHFGTFDLAGDAELQPTEELREAMELHHISSDEFWIPEFGEGRDVPVLSSDIGRQDPEVSASF